MSDQAQGKILYLEPFSGISGDMFLASLLDLGLKEEWLKSTLSKVLPGGAAVEIRKSRRGGITGTRFSISTPKETQKRNLSDVFKLLNSSTLSQKTKTKSKEMFDLLAEVEGQIHGTNKQEVHFHELGALDSIADIVGSVASISRLGVHKVYSGPVNAGSGCVEIAHGEIPVPAPATAELFKRGKVPTYSRGPKTELTTPTGALILTTFVDRFQNRPPMITSEIGYGLGSHEKKKWGNYLRASLGRKFDRIETGSPGPEDQTLVMETNLDDMNPELYPVVEEKLLKEGAYDVFKAPIQMKKNRPGVKLSVICNRSDRDRLSEIIFRETTTLGIRFFPVRRKKLKRKSKTLETTYGSVKIKIGYLDGEILNLAPEFESCRRLAEKASLPVKQIYREALSKAKEVTDN